jgi:diketogulonate reductase-like aldo/keto reductase
MNFPKFIYGTAWKEDRTTVLVKLALENGFRAIDTANQAKHYNEALVGQALIEVREKGINRNDIWLQSKFTTIDGQDERLPYDKNSSLSIQVKQSFLSSLEHLDTSYLDSYLLHGPCNYPLLGEEDFEIWSALEEIYKSAKAKSIGISNVNIKQLEMLVEKAEVKPMTVQNRCYASTGWDKEIREFCKTHKIIYQGFSLLTANSHILQNEGILKIAEKYQLIPAQILFRFAHQIGMIPLTGTTNQNNMKADLAIFDFELSNDEMEYIEFCAFI